MNAKNLGWTVAAIALTLGGPLAQAGRAVTLTPVGSAIDISKSFSPAFREASGLGLAKKETKLWSVSDENFTMYKMNLDGSAVTSFAPSPVNGVSTISSPDFEGVTYAPQPPGSSNDHYIYLANEKNNSILPVNYDSQKYHAPATLSSMHGYSSVTCDGTKTVATEFANAGSSGLEGITWDPDLNSFFVIKEKSPGLILQISQDLKTISACKVLTFSGHDYSDISYDPTRKQFWIVSDEADAVYLYDFGTNASVFSYNLGYSNGEGVAYDPDNHRLYITTDNGKDSDSYLYTYNVQ
jgi:uncharacterized protein YjiK